MLNIIDLDLLARIVHCIYGQPVEFAVNFTTTNERLERITVRELVSNNLNGSQLFSIDRELNIQVYSNNLNSQDILDCFRAFGIHAK